MRKVFLVMGLLGMFAGSAAGMDTTDILPYDMFINVPDIITINGEQFKIWAEINYHDDKVTVVENWLEWMLEAGEPDYTVRFVFEYRDNLETWDSGFLNGAFSVVYSEEHRMILIIQKSHSIRREGESHNTAFSYLIDIEQREVRRFLHPRIPSRAGFFENSNAVWIEVIDRIHDGIKGGVYLYPYEEMELYRK